MICDGFLPVAEISHETLGGCSPTTGSRKMNLGVILALIAIPFLLVVIALCVYSARGIA